MMSTSAVSPSLSSGATPFALALLPILALILIVFMATRLVMPVLPLHVHDSLGMGTAMVGLVTGAQFAAALVCLLMEAAGQGLIWIAPSPAFALAGAVLTGFGYSLVYLGFGIEAVQAAPPESRGLAMGAYTAFLNFALGVSGPVLGWIATGAGIASVFLTSTVFVLGATMIEIRLRHTRSPLSHATNRKET